MLLSVYACECVLRLGRERQRERERERERELQVTVLVISNGESRLHTTVVWKGSHTRGTELTFISSYVFKEPSRFHTLAASFYINLRPACIFETEWCPSKPGAKMQI